MDHAKGGKTLVDPFPNEQRGHARFALEVPLHIHCHTGELIQGRTVNVSESGISVIVPRDMLVGQAVELGFLLDGGLIAVQAMVKNKSAFRYGFEFVLGHEEREIITRGCNALAFG
jgi:PilZ domain